MHIRNKYRDGALAVESVHADIVVILEVAAIEEPADGGVGDRFSAARQIDQMIVPGPSLTHRRQGEWWRELDRDVTIFRIIST